MMLSQPCSTLTGISHVFLKYLKKCVFLLKEIFIIGLSKVFISSSKHTNTCENWYHSQVFLTSDMTCSKSEVITNIF